MKKFIREKVDATPIVDNVFSIVSLAQKAIREQGSEQVVNATIGSLYGEDEKLVAFETVFEPYDHIESRQKAKYAASFTGNQNFKEQVYTWVKQDATLNLAHRVIATPGGSGAISTTLIDILDEGETFIIPEIAWGSYSLMASMANIKTKSYSLFDQEKFNIQNFKEVCSEVMEKEGKVLAVINDPCHNPTGYSLTMQEWKQVIEIVNELSKKGPVILLNDIAYIDFAYDFTGSRKYLETFNEISDQVLIVIAFSCSKTLTSYGLRCGAALMLAQSEDSVKQLEVVMEKSARAIWSNIPNAAMENFVYVTTKGYDAFNREKASYVALLKQRSDIFIKEAKACNLIHYPYKEGFFVTLKIEDQALLNKYHQLLIDHHIYTVKVNKGIRVAICSLSIEKCKGLAKRMKDLLDCI